MFSFITRRFKKTKKKKVENDLIAPKKRVYQRGDPIPYSRKFTDADRIVVSKRDCERDNIIGIEKHILDTQEIQRITHLLQLFPIEGERDLPTEPCYEHVLTALKDDFPFAQMKIYDGNLMLENQRFAPTNERFDLAQTELYEMVKIQ